jgi:hypothetical protein
MSSNRSFLLQIPSNWKLLLSLSCIRGLRGDFWKLFGDVVLDVVYCIMQPTVRPLHSVKHCLLLHLKGLLILNKQFLSEYCLLNHFCSSFLRRLFWISQLPFQFFIAIWYFLALPSSINSGSPQSTVTILLSLFCEILETCWSQQAMMQSAIHSCKVGRRLELT